MIDQNKSVVDLLTEHLTGYPLAELDIGKDPRRLRRFKDSSGNYVVISNMPDIYEQFDHINSKVETRILPDSVRYLITDMVDYIDHIKEILTLNCYKNPKLYFKMVEAFQEDLPQFLHVDKLEDIVNYNDNMDTQFKVSTYRICKFEDKLLMIEGAVGLSITPVIYKSKPVFKQFKIEKLKNEIIEKNLAFDGGNIDKYKYPVLNICGYATWVKFINNINDKTFIPNKRLGQNNLNELYIDALYPDRKSEVEIDTPIEVNKHIYDINFYF